MTQCAAAVGLCLYRVYSFCPQPLFTAQRGLKSQEVKAEECSTLFPVASTCIHMHMTGQVRTGKSLDKTPPIPASMSKVISELKYKEGII